MANSIVIVNVSLQIAPTPATLQQTGALISVGGTITSPGTASLITQPSDLVPLLTLPASITTAVWSGGVVTVTTAAPHNLPNGQSLPVNIAGFTPAGYNGTRQITVTGASTFTYVLAVDPGATSVVGTWQNYSATELTQMVTTFFAQGFNLAVYVLELGASNVGTAIANLSAYLVQNPNQNYTPGALGYFYSYLIPREWDANTNLLTLMQSFESPTSKTYFWITTTLTNYPVYTDLMKCALVLIESPRYGAHAQNALTALSWSGGLATATTTTAHGVTPGEWFQIAGAVPVAYSGWWQAGGATTGSTLVWAMSPNPGAETTLGTLVASLIPNVGVTSAEFSMAAPFHVALNYAPSTTNRVTPFQFSFLFGVTPFPTRNNNSLLTTLKANFVNYVGTGAEGGISTAIILWGTNKDGQTFNYWYSVDWVQINLDLDTANAVINGSNNPVNPLYYNQPGIDVLENVAASTMARGIIFGLVNGDVTQVALDGPELDQNLNNGKYINQTVINAVPFVPYSLENPGDYKIGRYAGLSVIYMPQTGFTQIVYNVVVTELIAR